MAGPWDNYSAPPASGYVPLTPASPKLPLEIQHLQGENQGQPISQANTAAQTERTLTLLPAEQRKTNAEANKAETEAQVAAATLAAKPSPAIKKATDALANDTVLQKIQEARDEINKGWATGFTGGIMRHFDGTNATDLAGTLNTIGGNITMSNLANMKAQSPTGASGMGALSDSEGRLLRDSVASLGQEQSSQKLLSSLGDVERHYRMMRAIQDGKDPRDPNVMASYGILLPSGMPNQGGGSSGGSGGLPPPGGPGAPPGGGFSPNSPIVSQTALPTPDQASLAQGGTRIAADPALAGVNDKIRGMIVAGRSPDEIVQFMNSAQPGLGDSKASDVAAAVAFHRHHPEVPAENYTVSVDRRVYPMSAGDQAWNKIAQSAPTTAVANSLDALTAGALPSLTANPTQTRIGLGAISAAHPLAALGGTVAGGGLAGAGLETAALRLGAGKLAPLAADILYGGASGFNSADPGHGLAGAGLGALTGIGGGVAGRAAARGLGKAATGVRDESVRYLNDRGIPLTAGQIVSQSGVLGRGAKRAEDTLAGYPVVGDVVNARRGEGFQGFNQAAFDEGLAPIGASTNGVTGAQGVDLARAARSQAYRNALDGVQVTADQPFINEMGAAIRQGQALPDPMGSNADFTLRTRVGNSFDNAGNLTGNGFQQSVRGLRRDAKSMANLPYGYDFGEVTRGAEDALTGMLDRQAPGVMPAYNAANAANRNVEVLREAVNKARNGARTGETDLFAPSQLADAAAASAKKFGNSHGTTNQPFFDLTRHGQAVLPSKVADSGTAGRLSMLAVPAALGSLGAGGGYAAGDTGSGTKIGVGLGTLLALGGTKGGQRVLARALLDRPDALVRVGNTLVNRSRIAGMFGRPLALAYGSGN